jgi:hypothetical protein
LTFHLGNGGICSYWQALLDFGFHGVLVWMANMAWWDLVQACLARGHGRAEDILVSWFSANCFFIIILYNEIFNCKKKKKKKKN